MAWRERNRSTRGSARLLGAILGTLGAYLGLVTGFVGDLGELGRVPVPHLAVVLAGLPVAAAIAGWLLAGREPPAVARQPIA